MRRAVSILLIVAALPLWAGKKKPALGPLYKQPTQTVEIAGLQVPKPKQACPNWAWAAAVQLMLEEQKVTDFKQDYWILKSAGGELCIETPVDLDQLKQWIDGDHILLDGNHVHLEGVATQGAPQDVSYLVQLMKEGRTTMILWKGQPYVLQAVEYDEYIYPNNQRLFEARKLTMLDPIGGKPVVFEKTKDDIAELGGTFEVRVSSNSN